MKQMLSNEMEEMKNAFVELCDGISHSLSSRGVTTEELAELALFFGVHKSGNVHKPLLGEVKKELVASTSIHKSFIILSDHMSFFNLSCWQVSSIASICVQKRTAKNYRSIEKGLKNFVDGRYLKFLSML